jgi:predicted dithiol-disulfide oxidoreductase (DUF899 family)
MNLPTVVSPAEWQAARDRLLPSVSSCATATVSFARIFTNGRGVEALGRNWTFLDLTPLGRGEDWEQSPAGRPQSTAYEWWRLHDEYKEPA